MVATTSSLFGVRAVCRASSNAPLQRTGLRPAAERQIVGQTLRMPFRMRSIVLVTCALSFGAACDPGWSYHVPDSLVGVTRAPNGDGTISMRTRAGLSTGSLDVEIDLTNGDTGPLIVREDAFRVLDSSRRPLGWYSGHPPPKPCEDRQEKIVELESGDSCTMRGRFSVHPNVNVFGSRNTDLKTLTVIVDGLTKRGGPVATSAVLEWD